MEVVGLVLAVVPVVASAAKRWNVTYRTSRMVLSQKSKDAVAVDDYRQISWDLALVDINLRILLEALPTLSNDEKAELLQTGPARLPTQPWITPRVESALATQLGSVSHMDAVVGCLGAICEAVEAMISDRTLGLTRTDLMSPAYDQSRTIHTKLEAIRKNAGRQSEGVLRRLYFTSNAKTRHRARGELHDRVETFIKLVANRLPFQAAKQGDAINPASQARFGRPPDPRHRTMIHKVYSAMERKWDCGCAARHRAKMCLKRRIDSFDDDSIASLDMMISVTNESTEGWWHQGCVVLDPEPQSPRMPSRRVTFDEGIQTRRRRSSALLLQKSPVNTTICNLAREACKKQVTLELMFDNVSLWQLQPQPVGGNPGHTGDGMTLRDMLKRSITAKDKISLKDRRYLAVLLARSLLDFSESCWIRESWGKDDISFLTQDIKRPYLTTDFGYPVPDQVEVQSQPPTGDPLLALHPCPALLDLGILLLELQGDVGFIEDRVTSDGLVQGQVMESSILLTAQQMLEDLADDVEGGHTSDYLRAVQACLECNWTSEEVTAFSLSNGDFRMWIYDHVVVPLERNLSRGWKVSVTD